MNAMIKKKLSGFLMFSLCEKDLIDMESLNLLLIYKLL
jgi:hypothetical protein